MTRAGIGIDIGTDGVRVVVGTDRKGTFTVLRCVEIPSGAGGDPARLGAAIAAEFGKRVPGGAVFCGLTGRDVVMRYTQVPPVPDWQLRQLMEFEIKEIVEQSGDELAADFNLIPVASDLSSDDTVLLALAKEGVLNNRLETCVAAFGRATAFVPNAIALLNAYRAYRKAEPEDGTTLLVNIGAKNTDLAIARDGDLLFARNLSGGGGLFDEALIASFNVSADKACSLKMELADVAALNEGRALSSQEEKVSRALSGATGQLLSMVQSSIVFARSQTGLQELEVDRVFLCGGGSLLRGLDSYLSMNLGVPVSRFDPFSAVDAGGLEDDLPDALRATAATALGLAITATGDDVYSIEILPTALKKKRAITERYLFVALAVALVIGLLIHDAWLSARDTGAATAVASRLQRDHRQREKRLRDFEEGAALRRASAERIGLLEERVTPGTGLSRTLVLLQRNLSVELYVTSVGIARVKDASLGITGAEPRPVIEVRGEGREGAMGLERIFSTFAQRMAADPLLDRQPVTSTRPAGSRNPFEWTVVMNFATPSPSGVADEGEAPDGEVP